MKFIQIGWVSEMPSTTIKRAHSPDYPAISLKDAIDRARRLHGKIQTHLAPRELVAAGIGYASLNGASMSAIAALRKYGLLTKIGDQLKLSQTAMQILFPSAERERTDAVRSAALTPPLFGELYNNYGGQVPDDDLLRNQLLRKGFLLSALPAVIASFKETVALIPPESAPSTADAEFEIESETVEDTVLQATTPAITTLPAVALTSIQRPTESAISGERRIFGYEFESGGSVDVVIRGAADTLEALEIVGDWITLKRKELERKAAREKKNSDAPEN